MLAVGVAGLALAAGCSSFNRAWSSLAGQRAPKRAITGAWLGTWYSSSNGHHGLLRATISETASGDYRARFRARYHGIHTFEHTVTLEPERVKGQRKWRLEGEADLGALAGGVYRYEGHATPERFFATFEAKGNRGVYRMHRPGAEPPD